MGVLGITLTILGALTLTDRYTEDEILSYMKIMWKHRNVSMTSVKKEAEQFWNDVQIEYECCGIDSVYNYNSTVPQSCCANDMKPCTIDNAYRIFCFNAVKTFYNNVLVTILATAAFVTSFVCIGLIVSAQFSKRVCGFSDGPENESVL